MADPELIEELEMRSPEGQKIAVKRLQAVLALVKRGDHVITAVDVSLSLVDVTEDGMKG